MLGDYDAQRIRFMETQYVDDEIETGMQILRELYCIASTDQRIEIPMSELKIGLKCGGSDGFSGITANPLLGVFSDYLVAQGGRGGDHLFYGLAEFVLVHFLSPVDCWVVLLESRTLCCSGIIFSDSFPHCGRYPAPVPDTPPAV